MNDKELKRLSRKELLEILIEQSKEIAELRKTIAEQKEKLLDRQIKIENSGTLAEASLKLTEIFQNADEAAKLYLENVRKSYPANAQETTKDTENEKENKE